MADYIPRILINTGLNKLDVKSPERDGLDGWVKGYRQFDSMVLRDGYIGMAAGANGVFKQRVELTDAQQRYISSLNNPKLRVSMNWTTAGKNGFVRVSVIVGTTQIQFSGVSTDHGEHVTLSGDHPVVAGYSYFDMDVLISNVLGYADPDGIGITRVKAEIIADD